MAIRRNSVWKVSPCLSVSILFLSKSIPCPRHAQKSCNLAFVSQPHIKAGGLTITRTMAERFKLHKVSHDHSHETNDSMRGVVPHLHIPGTYGLRDTVVGRHACDNYNNNALITLFKDVRKMHLYRLFQKHYRSNMHKIKQAKRYRFLKNN
jgi:hypothetical protein